MEVKSMPTFNQLVRKGRKDLVYKTKSPALKSNRSEDLTL